MLVQQRSVAGYNLRIYVYPGDQWGRHIQPIWARVLKPLHRYMQACVWQSRTPTSILRWLNHDPKGAVIRHSCTTVPFVLRLPATTNNGVRKLCAKEFWPFTGRPVLLLFSRVCAASTSSCQIFVDSVILIADWLYKVSLCNEEISSLSYFVWTIYLHSCNRTWWIHSVLCKTVSKLRMIMEPSKYR